MIAIIIYISKISTRLSFVYNHSFASTVERTTAVYLKHGGISVTYMGIRYTSCRRGSVCFVLAVEHNEVAFLDLSIAVTWQERLPQGATMLI